MSAIVQWVHLLSAVLAVGGVAFVRLVLLPAAGSIAEVGAASLVQRAVARFRPILWTCIGLLLATGLCNVFLLAARGGLTLSGYTHVLTAKIVLALVMFGIAFALTLPGDPNSGLRARRKLWLAVNVAIGVTVLFLSAYLRRM